MKSAIKFIVLLVFSLILIQCASEEKIEVSPGFYYWKGNSALSENESKQLVDLKSEQLYVKLFEIHLDKNLGAIPVAKSSLHLYQNWHEPEDTLKTKVYNNLEIIPTIFIKNEVFKNLSKLKLDSLVDNTWFLIEKKYKSNFSYFKQRFSEIQIDCDWTESTQETYFSFLMKLKELSRKKITCTLRLYPYAYKSKLGVPPVDRATLMCYNLVSPLSHEDTNSILEAEELKKYLRQENNYPLELDIALPIYNWIQVYKNNKFSGLITNAEFDIDVNSSYLKPLWREVSEPVELENMYLRPGDKLKIESVSESEIKASVDLLKSYLNLPPFIRVTFFHLDTQNINSHDTKTLDSFISAFN